MSLQIIVFDSDTGPAGLYAGPVSLTCPPSIEQSTLNRSLVRPIVDHEPLMTGYYPQSVMHTPGERVPAIIRAAACSLAPASVFLQNPICSDRYRFPFDPYEPQGLGLEPAADLLVGVPTNDNGAGLSLALQPLGQIDGLS